uniref:RING-type domain-containing protein n=1 Tax=Steinernema glaseri TaxID=37863 RepID=A0A1I7Z238_9BILA
MPIYCSICQNRLCSSSSGEHSAAALPCGHVFHYNCVKQWFDSSAKTCPSCRAKCPEKKLYRLFLDHMAEDESDPQNEIEKMTIQLAENAKKISEYRRELQEARRKSSELQSENVRLKSERQVHKLALVKQAQLEERVRTFEKVCSERDRLRVKLQASELYECVMNSTYPEQEMNKLFDDLRISETDMFALMRSQQLQTKQKLEATVATLKDELDMYKKKLRDRTRELVELKQRQTDMFALMRSQQLQTKQKLEATVATLRDELDMYKKKLRDRTRELVELKQRRHRPHVKPSSPTSPVRKAEEAIVVDGRTEGDHFSADDTLPSNNTSLSMSFLNTPGPSTAGIVSPSGVVHHHVRGSRGVATPSAAIKVHQITRKPSSADNRLSFSLEDIPKITKKDKRREVLADVPVAPLLQHHSKSNVMTNRFSRHESLLIRERHMLKRKASMFDPTPKMSNRGVIVLE